MRHVWAWIVLSGIIGGGCAGGAATNRSEAGGQDWTEAVVEKIWPDKGEISLLSWKAIEKSEAEFSFKPATQGERGTLFLRGGVDKPSPVTDFREGERVYFMHRESWILEMMDEPGYGKYMDMLFAWDQSPMGARGRGIAPESMLLTRGEFRKVRAEVSGKLVVVLDGRQQRSNAAFTEKNAANIKALKPGAQVSVRLITVDGKLRLEELATK